MTILDNQRFPIVADNKLVLKEIEAAYDLLGSFSRP
jgi:hypothetical protein